MKKHFSIKSFAIIAAISALFISSSQIQPLSGHDYIRESVISDQYEISDSDLIITIESFLQNSVPGMDATYRQVIDILIDEGQNVWISGGILRDLLGSHPDKPHDLDFSFSGNPEEIQKIADKNGWLYTFFPGSKTITIGDRNGIFMEGLPKAFSVDRKDESEEFTINTIYYNCNKSCFLPESKIGLADLKKRILRIKTNRWYDWLFSGEEKYNKIFRFWKMAGKGYFFSKELESFIANETEKAWKKDRKLFSKQMLEYLGSHYSSFDQVEMGCRLVMGETWAKVAVSKLRKKAFKKDKEIDEVWDAYTHYPLHIGAQAIGSLSY